MAVLLLEGAAAESLQARSSTWDANVAAIQVRRGYMARPGPRHTSPATSVMPAILTTTAGSAHTNRTCINHTDMAPKTFPSGSVTHNLMAEIEAMPAVLLLLSAHTLESITTVLQVNYG